MVRGGSNTRARVQGAAGTVFRALYNRGVRVAVKKLNAPQTEPKSPASKRVQLSTEMKLFVALTHPHLVRPPARRGLPRGASALTPAARARWPATASSPRAPRA